MTTENPNSGASDSSSGMDEGTRDLFSKARAAVKAQIASFEGEAPPPASTPEPAPPETPSSPAAGTEAPLAPASAAAPAPLATPAPANPGDEALAEIFKRTRPLEVENKTLKDKLREYQEKEAARQDWATTYEADPVKALDAMLTERGVTDPGQKKAAFLALSEELASHLTEVPLDSEARKAIRKANSVQVELDKLKRDKAAADEKKAAEEKAAEEQRTIHAVVSRIGGSLQQIADKTPALHAMAHTVGKEPAAIVFDVMTEMAARGQDPTITDAATQAEAYFHALAKQQFEKLSPLFAPAPAPAAPASIAQAIVAGTPPSAPPTQVQGNREPPARTLTNAAASTVPTTPPEDEDPPSYQTTLQRIAASRRKQT